MTDRNPEKISIAARIRAFIARRRMSREQLRHTTKLGKSTIDKLLTGRFSANTLLALEERIGHKFHTPEDVERPSKNDLGAYLRSDFQNYEGSYLVIRPSFAGGSLIRAAKMYITWNDALPGLVFHAPGSDIALGSALAFPKNSRHLFIRDNHSASAQQMTLSRMNDTASMRGLMVALVDIIADASVPMAVPVVLKRVSDIDPTEIGRIGPEHNSYAMYQRELDVVIERKFGILHPGK